MEQRYSLLFSVSVLAFIQVVAAATGFIDIGGGRLYDADGYMRLVRVQELYENRQWLDLTITRSNAPFGEEIHWSRPLDVLLLAGAWVLSPLMGFKAALFWWGTLISPVFFIAALIAVAWAARPLVAAEGRVYLGFLLVSQPAVIRDFLVGRPDHHGLLIVLFILFLGLAFRLLARPFRPALCLQTAAAGAAAVWVSFEALSFVLVVLAVLALAWIKSGEDFARKAAHLSLGLALGLAVALAVEGRLVPLGPLSGAAFDAISIVHVGAFTGLATLAAILNWARRRLGEDWRYRLAAAACGLAVLTGVLAAVSPKLFLGPSVDIDPGIVSPYMAFIIDGQPILSGLRKWPLTLFWLGGAYVAVPFVLYLLWKQPEGADLIRRCNRPSPKAKSFWPPSSIPSHSIIAETPSLTSTSRAVPARSLECLFSRGRGR